MPEKSDRITKREALILGAIGGALVGAPSYLIAGDIGTALQGYDLAAFAGTLVRIVLLALIGALYAYLMPLPAEKWTAIERGVMAPAIVAALIINNGIDSKKLDQVTVAPFKVEIVSTANAQAQPKPVHIKPKPQPDNSAIRRFIRGLTGK